MRQRLACVHQVFDTKQFFAQTPRGMQRRKIIVTKISPFQQRDREGIAHGHRHGGARRGREIQRTRLFLYADIQHDVAGFRERRLHFSRQRHQRHLQPLQRFQQPDDLFRFSAVRNSQHRIPAREHPQVAVQRLRRVQEKGRSAGAR